MRSNERRDTGNVYTAACSSLFTDDNGKTNALLCLCMILAIRKDAYRKIRKHVIFQSSKVNHLFILSRSFQLFINSSPSSNLSIHHVLLFLDFFYLLSFLQLLTSVGFPQMKQVQFIFFFLVALI